jgi:hypothetical protein
MAANVAFPAPDARERRVHGDQRMKQRFFDQLAYRADTIGACISAPWLRISRWATERWYVPRG